MGRYINPFTDWGFKRLFGQEPSKDILIAFLNCLLEGEHHIDDVSFLNNEQTAETKDGRSIIYDVYCSTDKGEHIIVEMQNREQGNFLDRTLFYMAHAIHDQGQRGNWDYTLSAVYGVFFLNFKSKRLPDAKLRTDVALSDMETGKTVSPKMRMIYLQLPYFEKREEQCMTMFDSFIYTLTRMEALERMPFTKRNPIFERIAQMADVRTLTREEHLKYDRAIKQYRDYLAVKQFDKEEGRKERDNEIIRNMRSLGVSEEQIAKYLMISVEKCRSLPE